MVSSARALACVLLLSAAAYAPYQCASKAPPERRTEEEPAEALYMLAERFRAEGNARAREETLHFLIERYPSSRFVASAKADLAETAPAPPGPAPP